MRDFCVNNLGCGCNTIGIELCSGWQNCSCKTRYSGAACSECVEGYFMNGKQYTSKNTFHYIKAFSDCNWTRTQNHLVRKQTLNQFDQMVEYLFMN